VEWCQLLRRIIFPSKLSYFAGSFMKCIHNHTNRLPLNKSVH